MKMILFTIILILLMIANAYSEYYINIGDTWKTVTEIQINIGDVWKTLQTGYGKINIGDVWKTIP